MSVDVKILNKLDNNSVQVEINSEKNWKNSVRRLEKTGLAAILLAGKPICLAVRAQWPRSLPVTTLW